MCTVLLRFAPTQAWPLLLGAVRDEFVDRAWDPPAPHWPSAPGVVGGRDRTAGGTWLAVRRDPPAVAALLNGVRLPTPHAGARPSRGGLALAALAEHGAPAGLDAYDGFHLLLGTPERVDVWSWDGEAVTTRELAPGDHIIVNGGVDTVDDPLVPHFAPLLAALPAVDPHQDLDSADLNTADLNTVAAWGPWVELLRGDGLPGDDPRALIMRHEHEGRMYGSTSASLVAVRADTARFDFTAKPTDPSWYPVALT